MASTSHTKTSGRAPRLTSDSHDGIVWDFAGSRSLGDNECSAKY
jgi:hypothetical protein